MVLYAVLLHFGTLIAVFVCFWKDIVELVKELFLTLADLTKGRGLRLNERVSGSLVF